MTKAGADDLEAVRKLAETLEPFEPQDRERIIRWAREKLGMAPQSGGPTRFEWQSPAPEGSGAPLPAPTPPAWDIKSFVTAKDPKTDAHLAAVVAYFYGFVVQEGERKDAISSDDLVDACRKAERNRPSRPAQTMVNAFAAGLFDKAGHGRYKLNSVGENLVAMVLPGKPEKEAGRRKAAAKRKTTQGVAKPTTKKGRAARRP